MARLGPRRIRSCRDQFPRRIEIAPDSPRPGSDSPTRSEALGRERDASYRRAGAGDRAARGLCRCAVQRETCCCATWDGWAKPKSGCRRVPNHRSYPFALVAQRSMVTDQGRADRQRQAVYPRALEIARTTTVRCSNLCSSSAPPDRSAEDIFAATADFGEVMRAARRSGVRTERSPARQAPACRLRFAGLLRDTRAGTS